MVGSPISPSDEHLIGALRALRTEHPTLGIVKLHAVLLRDHPEWMISEKRFRKVLQQQGLNSLRHAHVQEGLSIGDIEGKVYPTSRIIERLDVEQWTKKVEVMWFGKKKGKGLVAKERIEKGATVWKEGMSAYRAAKPILTHIFSRPMDYCTRMVSVHPRICPPFGFLWSSKGHIPRSRSLPSMCFLHHASHRLPHRRPLPRQFTLFRPFLQPALPIQVRLQPPIAVSRSEPRGRASTRFCEACAMAWIACADTSDSQVAVGQ